ncbi:MAG: hypothetical protein ACRESC_04380, partial [Gammaproteobacteria bacterium]
VQVSRPFAVNTQASLASGRTAGGLVLGQRVQHPSFGEGVVLDCEGAGAHARVQVNFKSAGSKWLVVGYANLTPL